MSIPPKYEDVVANLDAALGREAALREELSTLADDYCEKVDDLIDLQQRLTVAEQRAREMEGMLAQVVSRCDYSLSCGKDALSKNCTAEIENIKLIAGGCSGWDCFAPIEG